MNETKNNKPSTAVAAIAPTGATSKLSYHNPFVMFSSQTTTVAHILVLHDAKSGKIAVVETRPGEEPELAAYAFKTRWQEDAHWKLVGFGPKLHEKDTDNQVIAQMAKHGIDKVRGGSWAYFALSEEHIKDIKRRLCKFRHECFYCHQPGHYVSECPKRRKNQGGRKCWNCDHPGHQAKECKLVKQVCGFCREYGHDTKSCRFLALEYCAHCKTLEQHATADCTVPYCSTCHIRYHHWTKEHEAVFNAKFNIGSELECGYCGSLFHESWECAGLSYCEHCRGERFHETDKCPTPPCTTCGVHGQPCLCTVYQSESVGVQLSQPVAASSN